MKSIYKTYVIILFSIFYSQNFNAQVVTGMNYQAVIRNSSNALVANATVGVKISILQGSATGTIVFAESHTTTTNANGLATFVIGDGTAITSTFFNIDWLAGLHFIKTETDPTGGSTYTISNTSQLNTVPYSQFAENSLFASYSGDSWKKTGNNVDVTTDFIGSTNDVDVVFKRNNVKAGLIGQNRIALGRGALGLNSGSFNVALGPDALAFNTGSFNIATGFESQYVNSSGQGNTSYGHAALRNNSTESYNTAIGFQALRNTTGGQNTAIGWSALENLTTGGGNIAIGKLTNVPTPTGNNQLSIGNVIYGANMGDTATGTIGIGVPVPTERLEVDGKTKTTNLQITAGAGANKVLTSDASGNATWQNANVNTGISVYKNASQIFANNTDTKIDFTAESVDDASAFDLITDEWTIPSTGFYHLYATARFSSFPANQTVEIVIYVNGLVSKYSRRFISGDVNFDISADLKLNLNDKIAVFVYQTSGAPATMPAGNATIYFSGYKIY